MTPLSAPLPLRSSTEWGSFREAVPIPERFGVTSGKLIQYNESRTQFVWAGHACQAIDEIRVAGQVVGDGQFRNTTDNTGAPIALVQFAQPIDEGAEVTATGRGRLHPVTGQLMTNPADVVWYVLANIAGRNVTTAQLESFRRECDRYGLEVGGSIEEADSTQTIVRGIVESVGAIYCADMPGIAKIWPGGPAAPSRARVRAGSATAECNLDDLCNDLSINYAHESGQPRASVQLEAPDSVALYGRRTGTLDAKWITSARVAAAVGTRILQQRARPVYVTGVPLLKPLNVGDTITIEHPKLPVTGDYMLLSRTVDIDARKYSGSVRAPCGDVPAVRIVRQSSTFEQAQYAAAGVQTIGGSRVIRLYESDGITPAANAKVVLDRGAMTRYTDGAGRVEFPVDSMPLGQHHLDITGADGTTTQVDVVVQ